MSNLFQADHTPSIIPAPLMPEADGDAGRTKIRGDCSKHIRK